MFATWSVGAVYVPVNRRYTAAEVRVLSAETPLALVIGERAGLTDHDLGTGAVEHDYEGRAAAVVATADTNVPAFDPGIALVLRTSGTTGRPKAVLLRHATTIASLDASLEKLRGPKQSGTSRGQQAAAGARPRKNMIPVSLALWAGLYNVLFSFRAGFGVVLLDRFTTGGFARAVREHHITSTVLAPAMITMLADDNDVDDLSPLRLVRSITRAAVPADRPAVPRAVRRLRAQLLRADRARQRGRRLDQQGCPGVRRLQARRRRTPVRACRSAGPPTRRDGRGHRRVR
jgi:acyl-CoA synthetase (AMP-forming)/AMP-acid ligase II